MAKEGSTRQRASDEQTEYLYQFMERNKDFAKGNLDASLVKSMWTQLTVKLNKIVGGEKRNAEAWRKAVAMVEEETRRYRPTKNYLESLPSSNVISFETELIKHEFERLQNRLPMEVLSMKRYELPPPLPGKMNDLSAWNESVENSCAQLEHQSTRICNLELMMVYGCETWKTYLELLIKLVSGAQKQLQILKKHIQEVNWQRKSMQTQGGEKLRALEAEWVRLVSKNYEIEQACVYLDDQIKKGNLQRSSEFLHCKNISNQVHESISHQNTED